MRRYRVDVLALQETKTNRVVGIFVNKKLKGTVVYFIQISNRL